MAKTRMMCPFSGKLCKECPIYRGRHYFLCFSEKYRGHLNEPGEKPTTSRTSSNGRFEMPSIIRAVSAFDPFDIVFKENKKEDD